MHSNFLSGILILPFIFKRKYLIPVSELEYHAINLHDLYSFALSLALGYIRQKLIS